MIKVTLQISWKNGHIMLGEITIIVLEKKFFTPNSTH